MLPLVDIYIFVFLLNLHTSKSVKALLHNGSYNYAYLFWIVSTIQMKFGQILVCCMASISNKFLAQCWRLLTSSRPFYDFLKMTI